MTTNHDRSSNEKRFFDQEAPGASVTKWKRRNWIDLAALFEPLTSVPVANRSRDEPGDSQWIKHADDLLRCQPGRIKFAENQRAKRFLHRDQRAADVCHVRARSLPVWRAEKEQHERERACRFLKPSKTLDSLSSIYVEE